MHTCTVQEFLIFMPDKMWCELKSQQWQKCEDPILSRQTLHPWRSISSSHHRADLTEGVARNQSCTGPDKAFWKPEIGRGTGHAKGRPCRVQKHKEREPLNPILKLLSLLWEINSSTPTAREQSYGICERYDWPRQEGNKQGWALVENFPCNWTPRPMIAISSSGQIEQLNRKIQQTKGALGNDGSNPYRD